MSDFSRHIEEFHTKKSIQRKDRFFVIMEHDFSRDPEDVTRKKLVSKGTNGSILPSYCIVEIQIPEHEFEKYKYHGHKSMAIIKRESLDFTITLEDDEMSSVNKFIRYMQMKNVNPGTGYIRPISQQTIDRITYKQYDQAGNLIEEATINNVKLIKPNESVKNYSGNESNKYQLLMSATSIDYTFTR